VDEPTTSSPDAIHLRLDGFEGPLDLLLELARWQRVDLARISITTLVDQYLDAITGPDRADLIQAADWLVMAAWLTWLKSRLLLPIDPEEAQEAQQAQQVLTQRLIELERVRATADLYQPRRVVDWTPSQAIYRMDTLVRAHPHGGDLLDFVPTLPTGLPNRQDSIRVAIASTLLASLELARQGEVWLRQDVAFEAIKVEAAPGARTLRRTVEQLE
jgi:segregation and condensation protein A